MQQLALDLERKLNARVTAFSDIAESRIRAKSKELERAEAEIQKVATDLTLTLYDLVEQIMTEIAVAKREIELPVDQPNRSEEDNAPRKDI